MAGKLIKGLVQIYTGNGKGKTTAALAKLSEPMGQGFLFPLSSFLKTVVPVKYRLCRRLCLRYRCTVTVEQALSCLPGSPVKILKRH